MNVECCALLIRKDKAKPMGVNWRVVEGYPTKYK